MTWFFEPAIFLNIFCSWRTKHERSTQAAQYALSFVASLLISAIRHKICERAALKSLRVLPKQTEQRLLAILLVLWAHRFEQSSVFEFEPKSFGQTCCRIGRVRFIARIRIRMENYLQISNSNMSVRFNLDLASVHVLCASALARLVRSTGLRSVLNEITEPQR